MPTADEFVKRGRADLERNDRRHAARMFERARRELMSARNVEGLEDLLPLADKLDPRNDVAYAISQNIAFLRRADPVHRVKQSEARLVWAGLGLILITLVPLAMGVAFDIFVFKYWGELSAYLGLGWLFPSLLLGIAAAKRAEVARLGHVKLTGVAVGLTCTATLL